jgi:hypothetical protein
MGKIKFTKKKKKKKDRRGWGGDPTNTPSKKNP